ncbi:MAG: Zn-dependent hydrolase [Ilumatobacteraceae bacterium]
MSSRHETLRVDGDRLWSRLVELGRIGAVHGPAGEEGCARLALTDADRDGRDLVVGWMHDLGLDVAVDRIGNVVATRPGTDPAAAPVMTGSHIDTVATGGRFDGNLGVLAGLEVVEVLEQHGVATVHPIAVAFFTDEEGARFAPDMLGSLVYAGGMALEEALDALAVDDGARLGDELDRIGYAGSRPCPTDRAPHAYVELHIEQGPILEDAGVTIGVVEGVQGISWTELTITGSSGHAGTTPMRLRHDAGYVAAEITTFARRLTDTIGGAQVATVGRLEVRPDLVNVIPGGSTLTVDLRNTDDVALRRAEAALASEVERLAATEGVTISTRSLARFQPVDFDPATVDLVEATAQRLGWSTQRLHSGAGHDAQMLARICPAAMIFTPSVGGLSHNIGEHTHAADVAAGADVLLQTLLALAVPA